jgi:orotate phosphoribosyltransferase-like protein
LRPHRKNFDSIAFRGVSGALVAPILAHKLKKHLISVRKNTHDSHVMSNYKVEGNVASQSYIIVDDFICSGNTIKTIVNEVMEWQERYGYEGKCYAVVCYRAGKHDNYSWNKIIDIYKKDSEEVLCSPLYIYHCR